MEVKDRILEKAADLFMKYGIRSITMDEIASQLGISKKTIYQFFTDKDEIVEGVIDQEIHRNQEECKRFKGKAENAVHEVFIALDEMEDMLKAMNPLIMYDLEKYHPKAYKKFKHHKYQFMYAVIRENLERGIKEENYREGMDVDIVSKQRIESAFMGFNQDIFPHNRYRVPEVSYELAMLYLHSVASPSGKKLIDKYLTERKNTLSHVQKL